MEALLEFLGFTTLEGIIWNSVAYISVLAIVYAVLFEKGRFVVFAIAGALLALYSHFFFHSVLFTTLQVVVSISAILQVLKVDAFSQKVLLAFITFYAFVFLFTQGELNTALNMVGAFGFLGIAVGIIMLPRVHAFLVMALGGGALIVYAFALSAWPFFVLNVFYTMANVWQWSTLKERARWKNGTRKVGAFWD